MTLTINLAPKDEERLIEAARRSGVEPSAYAKRLVEQNLPAAAATSGNDIGDLGGLSIADLAGDLIGSVSGEYTDMARHPEKYMDGFGEPRVATPKDRKP